MAGNIRAMITGQGQLARYDPPPPGIIVPIGPEGGAGQRPDAEDLVPAAVVAQVKGRDMMVDRFLSCSACPVLTGRDAEGD